MKQEICQIHWTFSDCEKYTDYSQECQGVYNVIIIIIKPTSTIYKHQVNTHIDSNPLNEP